MGFCIMNVGKQRRSAVYGLQIEANRSTEDGREFYRSDIDRERTKDNVYFRKCENWNKEITKQIKGAGLKERKDSVVMITGVYTASSEWFEKHNKEEWFAYFRACLGYHDRTYGRCFNAVVHLDEETPHMQVASVPIIEDEKGKHLSAKIIMGNRKDYQLRQDQFYEQVGRVYEMERGERRDPAEMKVHTTKREWQIAKQREELEQVEREIREAKENAARIASELRRSELELKGCIETLETDKRTLERKIEALQGDLERLEGLQLSTEEIYSIHPEEQKGLWGKTRLVGITLDDVERLQATAASGNLAKQELEKVKAEKKELEKQVKTPLDKRIEGARREERLEKLERIVERLPRDIRERFFGETEQKNETQYRDGAER